MRQAPPDLYAPFRHHPVQRAFWDSNARFIVAPAGRRSGKTAIAKRKLIMRAIDAPGGLWYVCAAPTHQQARRIFWEGAESIKKLSKPFWADATPPSESMLTITLENNSRITVLGMDKPERIEGGDRLAGIILDEYANMKPSAWPEHVRPALSDPGLPAPGWAFFTGVPEGRNHYYDLWLRALDPRNEEWAPFHWKSAEILDPEEVDAAREEMDELVFQQEYEASFISFGSRIYYCFTREVHAVTPLQYDPKLPLLFCFDFNVEPGVAAICQNQQYRFREQPGHVNPHVDDRFTAVIGEVCIPRNSTTPAVCRRLMRDWAHHKGKVICYGDATGGARGTAQVEGSDWELIRKELSVQWKDLDFQVPRENPRERARVNATNSRFKSADQTIRMLIDPSCVHVIEDFDGVRGLAGGSGEIDKRSDPELTHVSDAIGYMVHREYPVVERVFRQEQVA